MGLNDAQLEAVEITTGPALIVAGAGTGKTRVIVERIQCLIDSGVPASQILALTFTEKAAAEMQDRLNDAASGVQLDATIMTFNGFGNELLERFGTEWGLGTLQLLGDTGRLVFLREHLDDFGLDYFAPVSRPEGQLELLAKYVSGLKQQIIMPEDYMAYAAKLPANDQTESLEKQKQTELARFYETYRRLCRSAGVIDYDDQLFETLLLLRARPNILKQLQTRYQYILVDEFQDTNPLQSALIDLLAGATKNVMVVGDDDQSIYGWRGATLANILDFKDRYPASHQVTLIENYRSSQAILDTAYRLIQHNNPQRLEIINKLDKRLVSREKPGPTPIAKHFATLDAELAWVAKDIQIRLDKGQKPKTIAVLARRNHGVQKVHEFLELYDVAHNITGLGNDIYQELVVQQLIEALKVVADPLDTLALFHTLGGPLFQVDVSLLATISASAKREHQPLHEALAQHDDEAVATALQIIEAWRTASREQTVGLLAYQVITDSQWKQTLYEGAEHDPQLFRQVQALSKFFKTLKEFETISDVASVQSYIANLSTLKAAGSGFEDASLDISDDQLNVLSLHRAKGLEWDTVYIIDCTEGSFPMRNFGTSLTIPDALLASRSAADEHMAEERRLMYVGATRARRDLILSYSDSHTGTSKRKPSRFLTELLGELDPVVAADPTNQTELELFAPKPADSTVLPASMHRDGSIVLSVSQIDCYLRCPQDFYYLYVLQMPVPPAPQLKYGTAIHSVIESIHTGLAGGTVPSLDSLLTDLRASLPRAGYASPRSRDRAHAQAEATVRKLYAELPTKPQPSLTERPFRVDLPDSKLVMVGRMDAVYDVGKGIEIRDFKTGTSVTTPEKAKQRATGSNQLTLYALAWQLQHNEMPALLTLDFVETGQTGSVRKQAKSLETMTGKLQQMVQNLQAGNYEPGNDHTFCKHPY